MNKVFFHFLILNALIFAISCGTKENKQQLTPHPKVKIDIPSLRKNCLNKDGLSCAKLGYHYNKSKNYKSALKFYKIGCELKDQSSCFNLRKISPREKYFLKVDSLMKFHSNNITNCYQSRSMPSYSSMQLAEKWSKAEFNFTITPKGFAEKVTIKTQLPGKFSDCAKNIIKSLRFPIPGGFVATYSYILTIKSTE
ncbi:MAG: sel1 repeat family protein [Bacteriovoracaceae bacterium]|nr:sel1 repeat family protein [Bacteriovoracaceae bacterium]